MILRHTPQSDRVAFHGQPNDEVGAAKQISGFSGLYFYGYSYYDPQLGRWISRDPIGEKGGLNLYAFVRNNGVNKIDFLGLIEPPTLAPPIPPRPEQPPQELPGRKGYWECTITIEGTCGCCKKPDNCGRVYLNASGRDLSIAFDFPDNETEDIRAIGQTSLNAHRNGMKRANELCAEMKYHDKES